jgi:cytoskeletal protein CcmA (bactofilin family)
MPNLGRSVVITGDVTSDEDLRIDGKVRGSIVVREGTLVIGPAAQLLADIRGQRVRVEGTVRGTITASERIELAASGTVLGNLSANRVIVADGASFNGRIDMDQRTIAAKVAQYKAQAV